MAKIQLESGPSSSATHRLTQPSSTLNRHYVDRPTTLAIEEAASTAPSEPHTSNGSPSRLVNLRVHETDLESIQNQTTQASYDTSAAFAPVIPQIVEMGSLEAYSALNQVVPSEAPTTDADFYNTVTETPNTNFEPSAQFSQPSNSLATQPSFSPATTNSNDIDTQALMMNIAADYAAASFGTATSAAPTPATPSTPDSIDLIARAASEAIAAIRVATEPSEIAEQISSLEAFAANIKADSSHPEMAELGDTIEKFISVAMKSSKVQEETKKAPKVALTPKANRAASKVTKSSAKLLAANQARQKRSATTSSYALSTAARPQRATNRTRPQATRSTRPAAATTRRSTSYMDNDQALRRALNSVASMDRSLGPGVQKRNNIRRKGKTKHFILALACATACVAAVIYFVSTNIPDISVRVAAMQTGVEASYPSYIPRDYSLSDISSENGKITLIFNGPNEASFTLVEEKSSWDSTTLLRNYVEPTWKDNYITTHEQGITIYISGTNAAWVNGGVLYKINSSDNNLTKKQLRNIVTSM